ncbi:hypothetical protein BHM03_00019103 [Ensete ventricosum]|nr:hypothetical protein BHM03_00019103 [Ensete ventricosum]
MTILHTGLFGNERVDPVRPLRCQVRENPKLPSWEGEVKRRELVSTPSLTFVVPRDMTEMYGGRVAAAAWGEGMACHATLMGVGLGSVVPGHLHLEYQIGYRPGPSG